MMLWSPSSLFQLEHCLRKVLVSTWTLFKEGCSCCCSALSSLPPSLPPSLPLQVSWRCAFLGSIWPEILWKSGSMRSTSLLALSLVRYLPTHTHVHPRTHMHASMYIVHEQSPHLVCTCVCTCALLLSFPFSLCYRDQLWPWKGPKETEETEREENWRVSESC